MDEPEVGTANNASSNTVDPTAIAEYNPVAEEPLDIFIINSIKKNVRNISSKKDCNTLPEGIVTPKFSLSGKIIHKNNEAVIAPATCKIM